MRKQSIWLIGVILLGIASFLYVFQPVTFSPRENPANATLYLRPLGVKAANWDARSQNQNPSFKLGSIPVYAYKPRHDLMLGLDLQGGMRVVLEIPNRGKFEYELKKPIAIEDMTAKKVEFTDAVRTALGKDKNDPDVIIDLSEKHLSVTTYVENDGEARDQLIALDKEMAKLLGEGNFVAPKKTTVFLPAKDVQNDVLSILERRVNPDGVREVISYPKNDNQVVIEIPGERDPERVKEIINTRGQLRFMLIDKKVSVNTNDATGTVTAFSDGKEISQEEALKSATEVITGSDLVPERIQVTLDQSSAGKYAVAFTIKQNKQQHFGNVTLLNKESQLAIVLDNEIQSAPVIRDQIVSDGVISGNFTQDDAKKLATLLKAGALPVKVSIVENRTVSATLGAESIAMSLKAGLIGFLAVLIFMVAYYRLPGIMASFALIIYIFLNLAVLRFFQATITLPGIAGIIISIGMAVDANIIIFERLKEELRTQKPLETAINVAFARAWTAILDSNVASLITGFVLFWLGTGAIKGFAVTLLIGVAVSMFTAITVTRLFMKLMIRSRAGHKLSWYGV